MKLERRPSRASAAGWTLIEIAIGLVIASVISSTLLMVLSSTSGVAGQILQDGELSLRAAQVLERVTRETQAGSLGSFDPALDPDLPVFASDLRLMRVVSTDGSGATLGSPIRIWIEYEDGETNDGTDENGDGLVDECVVKLTINAGTLAERTVVLARGVSEYLEGESANGLDDNGNGLTDERGLAFRRVDDGLQVFLTLERAANPGGILHATTRTTVHLRNE